MKFAKVLEQTLIEEDIPEEWISAAIQYKALKKCINKVVTELEFLGLQQSTLKLLLQDTTKNVIELNEQDTVPTNKTIAEYTLTNDGSEKLHPMLKISLDYSNENYTDDHIQELGIQLKKKLESLLNDDNEWSENPKENDKIIELQGDELLVVSAAASREGTPKIVSRESSPTRTTNGTKKNEIFITLNSDLKFFKMLDDELVRLDDLKTNEEKYLISQVQTIGDSIKKLTSPNLKLRHSDMYKWRELFRIYLDSEVYFKYNESSASSGERNSDQIKANLLAFASNVEKSGILQEFRMKNSVAIFKNFLAMNFHLLKICQFQLINSEAFRKILKKFDKQTALGVSMRFPQMMSTNHIFFATGTSMAQKICYIIQSSILTLLPQLEDYTCPICMSVAFKPIRLLCNHVFCVRCLVMLKKDNKADCPMCRQKNVINKADGSNLDIETMELMKKYFPIEVKEKIKERDKEKYTEIRGDSKCILQ